MLRKGNCYGNAVIESFLGRIKIECFHGKSFASIEELEKVIKDYLRYYNEEKIQLRLRGLSPIQYRKQYFIDYLTFFGQIIFWRVFYCAIFFAVFKNPCAEL